MKTCTRKRRTRVWVAFTDGSYYAQPLPEFPDSPPGPSVRRKIDMICPCCKIKREHGLN